MPGGGCSGGCPRCFVLGVHWWAYGGRGLAAWRHSCCGPLWCARWLLLGSVVSLVASLAAAAVVGVCVGGGGARAACVLSPGAGRRPGPLWAFSAFIL